MGPHCSLIQPTRTSLRSVWPSHNGPFGPRLSWRVGPHQQYRRSLRCHLWALRWIEAHPLAPSHAFEICSDRFYAMDRTAGLLPTQDWGLLPNGDLLHNASNALESLLTRGIHLAFRKGKAHSSLRDRDATLNDRANRLAKIGMRLSRGDTPSLSPLAPLPRPASTLTVTISIASDVARSTFSWGFAIAQVPPDGSSEVFLHAAAGFPILSPPHPIHCHLPAPHAPGGSPCLRRKRALPPGTIVFTPSTRGYLLPQPLLKCHSTLTGTAP